MPHADPIIFFGPRYLPTERGKLALTQVTSGGFHPMMPRPVPVPAEAAPPAAHDDGRVTLDEQAMLDAVTDEHLRRIAARIARGAR